MATFVAATEGGGATLPDRPGGWTGTGTGTAGGGSVGRSRTTSITIVGGAGRCLHPLAFLPHLDTVDRLLPLPLLRP